MLGAQAQCGERTHYFKRIGNVASGKLEECSRCVAGAESLPSSGSGQTFPIAMTSMNPRKPQQSKCNARRRRKELDLKRHTDSGARASFEEEVPIYRTESDPQQASHFVCLQSSELQTLYNTSVVASPKRVKAILVSMLFTKTC